MKATHDESLGPVSLADESKVLDVVAASVLSLWDAVNNLTRLTPTRRERYRVTIFGSARVDPQHWVYGAVRDLAMELTRAGCDIATGGGPGLMSAANEGAKLADPDGSNRSVGIRITLPFEQDVNAFVTQAYEHRTFFTRLHQFVIMSDAFVVVPGGIGTLLETAMIWQLLQVNQIGREVPLVLVGDMYRGLIEWCSASMLKPDFALASAPDMEIPICVPDAPSAIRVVLEHHERWIKAREAAAVPA